MQAVHTTLPHDADVIALYAEAMMTKTPWQLWNIYTGEPAPGADTVTAVQVLEAGLQLMNEGQIPPHPGILHMVIHALEMSPQPEKALPAAAALRDLAPDSGHLCHMPTHIDALCGQYAQAVVASEKAIAADKKYLAQVGPFGFYTTAVCHDIHMLMYAAMFLGQYERALTAVHDLTQLLTEEGVASRHPPSCQHPRGLLLHEHACFCAFWSMASNHSHTPATRSPTVLCHHCHAPLCERRGSFRSGQYCGG